MSPRVTPDLPERLVAALRDGGTALLLTTGADGYPASAFTWVVAIDAATVRFGADLGTATLANLQRDGRGALQIIAEGNLVYLIKGEVRLARPRLEAAPMKVALMQMAVREVKDQSWQGVTVLPLRYDWAPDQRAAMEAMERAVYAEMRAWTE